MIVRCVESLFGYADRLEARYTVARAHVERLTPTLLAKAFRGELVPQDPNDEPAAVLLERIRALRGAAGKIPRPDKAKQANKEVRELMQKLLDVLAAAKDWLPAEEAFRRCGVSDGAQTDRVEELYTELRQLDKAGTLRVRRTGDRDELRLEPEA
jgi:type I restriction enzyme S subunit